MSSTAPATPRAGLLGLTWRQLMTLIALINAFVATYLHLWKIGKAGTLACGGTGGCALVQMSPWGWFFGVDVALIGAVFYTTLVVLTIIGSLGALADSKRIAQLLIVLVSGAVLFTIRLKWAEFYKLKSFCPWCAISAVSVCILAVMVYMEWRRVRAIGTPAA